MKFSRCFFPAAVIAALFQTNVRAADAELQTEYAQVRKIAMKDAGVRAAFAKADAKLKAKMIEIDPSLKPIVEKGGVVVVIVQRRWPEGVN